MPLERCTSNGAKGWRWGTQGKCYLGPDGKKKALKQGYAEDPKNFKNEVSKGNLVTNEEVDAVIQEESVVESAAAYLTKKERDAVSEDDFGDPANKKYPIRNQDDLDAAARLIGRAPKEKQAAIKERIKKIAKRKGLKLPDSWQ